MSLVRNLYCSLHCRPLYRTDVWGQVTLERKGQRGSCFCGAKSRTAKTGQSQDTARTQIAAGNVPLLLARPFFGCLVMSRFQGESLPANSFPAVNKVGGCRIGSSIRSGGIQLTAFSPLDKQSGKFSCKLGRGQSTHPPLLAAKLRTNHPCTIQCNNIQYYM